MMIKTRSTLWKEYVLASELPTRTRDRLVPVINLCNHKSALHLDRIKEVEHQIRYEIENGRYLVVKNRPRIVSGLAAIPNAEGLS